MNEITKMFDTRCFSLPTVVIFRQPISTLVATLHSLQGFTDTAFPAGVGHVSVNIYVHKFTHSNNIIEPQTKKLILFGSVFVFFKY